jgi:hypothetical protein
VGSPAARLLAERAATARPGGDDDPVGDDPGGDGPA